MAEGRRRKIEFIAAKALAKTMSAEEICKNVIRAYGIGPSQFLLTLAYVPQKVWWTSSLFSGGLEKLGFCGVTNGVFKVLFSE